jgi:hypothetical protein
MVRAVRIGVAVSTAYQGRPWREPTRADRVHGQDSGDRVAQ